MFKPRIIPILLISNQKVVKTIKFKERIYVGDPLNTIKLFNDKEVDEIIVLDIDAKKNNLKPNYLLIEKICSQCFMPIAYGGGITNLDEAKKILSLGVEKLVFNSSFIENRNFIKELVNKIGSQSVVSSLDIKRNFFGKYKVFSSNGNSNTGLDPFEFAKELEKNGVGEILINSIENDGLQNGYDLKLIREMTKNLNIPVIACGGASSLEDMKKAFDIGASAVAAGSLFIFKGPYRAVLINYPDLNTVNKIFSN